MVQFQCCSSSQHIQYIVRSAHQSYANDIRFGAQFDHKTSKSYGCHQKTGLTKQYLNLFMQK